jgi:hypothetical protein
MMSTGYNKAKLSNNSSLSGQTTTYKISTTQSFLTTLASQTTQISQTSHHKVVTVTAPCPSSTVNQIQRRGVREEIVDLRSPIESNDVYEVFVPGYVAKVSTTSARTLERKPTRTATVERFRKTDPADHPWRPKENDYNTKWAFQKLVGDQLTWSSASRNGVFVVDEVVKNGIHRHPEYPEYHDHDLKVREISESGKTESSTAKAPTEIKSSAIAKRAVPKPHRWAVAKPFHKRWQNKPAHRNRRAAPKVLYSDAQTRQPIRIPDQKRKHKLDFKYDKWRLPTSNDPS